MRRWVGAVANLEDATLDRTATPRRVPSPWRVLRGSGLLAGVQCAGPACEPGGCAPVDLLDDIRGGRVAAGVGPELDRDPSPAARSMPGLALFRTPVLAV